MCSPNFKELTDLHEIRIERFAVTDHASLQVLFF